MEIKKASAFGFFFEIRPRFASKGHVTSRVARVPRIRGFTQFPLDLSSMSLIMNRVHG